ncbi:hypothetical protein SAMN05421858_1365 [Haladaptatus litoreus]|uniref:DUF7344 domain-containing protein n=1 Tax=Haladaptatus litoreus TaxID=553468 RepID=A0A1N6Y1X8_9EURY|nr:hypothetical protein [Haladaptatus litoreus]SIR08588.1 hypothetical protein SAMN05421858_1365 [Haladaptatus litoreus]
MSNNKVVLSDTDALSSTPSAVFEALQHPLRREVVCYLTVHECPISLAEMVESMFVCEKASSDDRRRTGIDLHHNHLPKLMDYGFIVYDTETNTVERTCDISVLEKSLSLASRHS